MSNKMRKMETIYIVTNTGGAKLAEGTHDQAVAGIAAKTGWAYAVKRNSLYVGEIVAVGGSVPRPDFHQIGDSVFWPMDWS